MRLLLSCAVAALTLTACKPVEKPMTDTVVLLAGQSNALGYLNNGPVDYEPSSRVFIWTDGGFRYMNPGQNTGTPANPNAHGPEVQFAKDWLADHPTGNLYIGKVAKGETGLAQDDATLDWSPNSHGELWDKATEVAQKMLAATDDPALDVLWMQGETDAMDAGKAASYAGNLTNAVEHMHADWHADHIIIGRIAMTGAYSQDVRVAEWALDQARDDVTSFKTIGYDMQPDSLHYSAAGHIQLGAAFYDGWTGF